MTLLKVVAGIILNLKRAWSVVLLLLLLPTFYPLFFSCWPLLQWIWF